MKIRSSRISSSIAAAITQDRSLPSSSDSPNKRKKKNNTSILTSLVAFFALFRLRLARLRPADFFTLRHEAWKLNEDEYLDSFPAGGEARKARYTDEQGEEGDERRLYHLSGELVPVGDLGYSGSTFFTTPNGKFLVKSLPRRFEHQFFTRELLEPYVAHAKEFPDSLLARIMDMPYAAGFSLGAFLGTAPTHHIVMENLLYGKDAQGEKEEDKWETYDLKPDDYFFPERDIADGNLAPQSVKDRLIDTFPDKVIVSLDDRERLITTLNHDTQLLSSHAAVDYSLFLIRYPQPSATSTSSTSSSSSSSAHEIPTPPHLPSDVPCIWREGVNDVRGAWTYRAIVLDFFWAKSALQAKVMTGAVDALNVVADQGPMSITAEPGEYRQRFMKMVEELVVTQE